VAKSLRAEPAASSDSFGTERITACHIWIGIALHIIASHCVFYTASAWGSLNISHIDRKLQLRQYSIGYGPGRSHGMVWDSIVGGVGVQPSPSKGGLRFMKALGAGVSIKH
jgi:hypothetical protein